MRAHESPFELFMSKRNLFFAYLLCSSVSGPKALKKKHVCDLPYSISVKSYKTLFFEIGLKKYGVIVQKSLLKKRVFRSK